MCCKNSNDVMRQAETPSKRTIFVARQIYFVVRHNFHVASVITLYHDCKTGKCCNRLFLVWLPVKYYGMVHHFFCIVGYIIKHLFYENLLSFTEPLVLAASNQAPEERGVCHARCLDTLFLTPQASAEESNENLCSITF